MAGVFRAAVVAAVLGAALSQGGSERWELEWKVVVGIVAMRYARMLFCGSREHHECGTGVVNLRGGCLNPPPQVFKFI